MKARADCVHAAGRQDHDRLQRGVARSERIGVGRLNNEIARRRDAILQADIIQAHAADIAVALETQRALRNLAAHADIVQRDDSGRREAAVALKALPVEHDAVAVGGVVRSHGNIGQRRVALEAEEREIVVVGAVGVRCAIVGEGGVGEGEVGGDDVRARRVEAETLPIVRGDGAAGNGQPVKA